ncbi:MAG TPA: MFS transporter [Pirellulales bacterium]|nr:MFS transporter [Pirellulales bacterium]
MSDDATAIDLRSRWSVLTQFPASVVGFSQRALDATAFFLADAADGLGPFLVIDLTTRRGWNSADAGAALAVMLLATVATQTFTGAWIDRTRFKRRAIAVAALTVGIATVALYFASSKPLVYALQTFVGAAVTVFPPALAAISLGLVGRTRLAWRAGRNEACFHAGNVTAAALAACSSHLLGPIGMFVSVAAMAVVSSVAALLIPEREIDHRLARGADGGGEQPTIVPIRRLLEDRRIWWFVAAAVLFHFANAAMLPLVGQKVGHKAADFAPTLMAACIIVAQITMVPVAMLAGRFANFGRKSVFLVAFAVLPVRGLLYTLTDSSLLLIANQVLDGIGAGIFGVVALLMMADYTRGTGRFNFAQAVVATSIGVGAAASNYVSGRIVDSAGFDAGFAFLAAVAVIALLVFALRVPESLQETAEAT